MTREGRGGNYAGTGDTGNPGRGQDVVKDKTHFCFTFSRQTVLSWPDRMQGRVFMAGMCSQWEGSTGD